MADSKLSALTELSVPALEDLLYVVDDPAGTPVSRKLSFNRALGQLGHIACGRLTLATGQSVYAPQPATPSSTDTATEIVTFAAAHGWVTGTMCTVSATGGGLTAGTTYYLNALSTTTAAFYTTLANAEANTSKVDLTASITAQVIPFGVQSTTIRYTPHNGNLIAIPDGTRTKLYTFSELSLALGTLVSGSLYDVFAYDSAGAATLKLGPAWSSATSRGTGAGTTEVTLTNGVWVNAVSITSGPAAGAGRLLGTIRMISTTAGEDSQGYNNKTPKRFIANVNNILDLPVFYADTTTSFTYSSTTIQQYNANTAAQIEVVSPLGNVGITITASCLITGSAASQAASVGFGLDSTTSYHLISNVMQASTSIIGGVGTSHSSLDMFVPIGYHVYSLNQAGNGSGTQTWYGFSAPFRYPAISGSVKS